MKTIIKFDNETFTIRKQTYAADGTTRIDLIDLDGIPYCTLTVCIAPMKTPIGKNQIFVKTWSENGPITDFLRNSQWFEDTGERFFNGHVDIEIWVDKTI